MLFVISTVSPVSSHCDNLHDSVRHTHTADTFGGWLRGKNEECMGVRLRHKMWNGVCLDI